MAAADDQAGHEFFERKIRPVLVQHCYQCHAEEAETVEGGLLLDSRFAIRTGGDSGPAIVAGRPGKSLLLEAIEYESLEMPPSGKLPDDVIADFAKWIEMGAPDPREGETLEPDKETRPDGSDHWAFQKPKQVAPPDVANKGWPNTPIDHFILHKLESAGLEPGPPADKLTLLRRLYFDLIGLPPTPQQVDAFLSDDSPAALEKVVDELLASPHFGERWGRHWMDVARYADSVGGGGNVVFDNAWRYRDWVIQSFNEDKPYDQFVLEQIAGDLLPADDAKRHSQNIIATGYLALGRRELPEYDKLKLKLDVVDEQIDTLGKSLLGLSLGCARCHDHKFDPVSAAEYYALAGIFESTEVVRPPKGGPLSTWVLVSLPDKSGQALAVRDAKTPIDAAIRIRGDVHRRSEVVPRGVLSVLETPVNRMPSDQSGRLQLGQWIASKDNPLVARVMVNRMWHWLFGRGIVATPDNFGLIGAKPSHPELLDWLAVQFIAEGWSVKQTVRRIVLSRTYQLSCQDNDIAARKDPENQLWWRHSRRRLEAEIIRDAMLAVAGELDTKQFGKTLTYTGRLEGSLKKVEADPWHRRSVYLPRYREDKQVDIMQVFDAAHPALVTGSRIDTTVPTQALYLMNSPFVKEQSKALAAHVLARDDVQSVDDKIRLLYQLALARPATETEVAADERFLQEFLRLVSSSENDHQQAWTSLCQTILASNEFLFVE